MTAILINTTDDSNLDNQGSDSITSLTSNQVDYAVSSIDSQLQLVNTFFSTLILSIGIIYIIPTLSIFFNIKPWIIFLSIGTDN